MRFREARNVFVKRMQWYRYWAICEYSGVLTYSPQTCENLSVLEKEILKEGGITDWVHSRPSMFYFSKLYCLFALFLFLNSFFTFTSRNIICQVFDPLNLLLYRLSPRSFAIQRTVVCVYWLQSICRKKKRMGYVELTEQWCLTFSGVERLKQSKIEKQQQKGSRS